MTCAVLFFIALTVVMIVVLTPSIMIKNSHGPGWRTRVMLKDLQIGFKGYRVEYDKWPVPKARDDFFGLARGPLIRCLLGEMSDQNTRQIKFVDLPVGKAGKYGIVHDSTGEPWVLDEWGRPIFIGLDANEDEKLAMPDGAKDAPPILPVAVALFSAGPDGIPGNGDDVTSWR